MVLLTRTGCHLCESAQDLIERVCADRHIGWRAIDIDSDQELASRYTDHVPVVFVDGRLHGYWFVDQDALRREIDTSHPAPMDEGWRPVTNQG